jgi:hypothetical protein
MGVPIVVNTPVHWHLGVSIDDPSVVRALAALGVPTERHQVYEVPPDLRRTLRALIDAAGDTRFGIVVDDPGVVRALAALRDLPPCQQVG